MLREKTWKFFFDNKLIKCKILFSYQFFYTKNQTVSKNNNKRMKNEIKRRMKKI